MKVKKGFLLKKMNDESVLIAVGEATKTLNGMLVLNETGAFLFENMQGEFAESELVNLLAKEYELSEKKAKDSVKNFLARLIELGIIDL